MGNTDTVKEIDNLIYSRMREQINGDFNIDWKYREQWKMGYYDGEKGRFYDQYKDSYALKHWQLGKSWIYW